MHFARTGLADHADDLAAGSAADDGIVDRYDAAALQQMTHRVKFELDSEIADRLRGFDERCRPT